MKAEYGKLLYTEERDTLYERIRDMCASLGGMAFILMVSYVGSLRSFNMFLFTFILTLPLLLLFINGLLFSILGIRPLQVYEKGFFAPYCTDFRTCLDGGFIKFSDIELFYPNKRISSSRIFPYLVIQLKKSERNLAIPIDRFKNIGLFTHAIRPYVKISTSIEKKIGLFPVNYFLPSREAHLLDDRLFMSYVDNEENIYFNDIKKMKIKAEYQIITNEGEKLCLLGMGINDFERIQEGVRKFYIESIGLSGVSSSKNISEISGGLAGLSSGTSHNMQHIVKGDDNTGDNPDLDEQEIEISD